MASFNKVILMGNLTRDPEMRFTQNNMAICNIGLAVNRRYKDKFEFPFILAVRGYNRGEILEIFCRRVENDPQTEFETALEQVHRIAILRLRDIA